MRRTANATAAVAYLRCSTEEQHLGPEAQRQAIEEWARRAGVAIVAVHEDLGVGGGVELDRRPGLLAALDALRAHRAGALVVAKRDRLARDVVVAGMVERLVERSGAHVVSADGTGNGDGPEAGLLRGIVDVFAQYERALIKARTKSALRVKRSRGEKTGGEVPFGHGLADDGIHLVADPTEQIVIARARALQAEGLTLRGIAQRLEEEGLRARFGRWHPEKVRRILGRTA